MNKNKKALIALKKAHTSLSKIIKMTENGEYCIDILQQVLAVRGLLNSASNKILEDHLTHCFSEGIRTKNTKTEVKLINELIDVLNLHEKAK